MTISRAAGSLTISGQLHAGRGDESVSLWLLGGCQTRVPPRQIETYRQRISGPILDRTDLHSAHLSGGEHKLRQVAAEWGKSAKVCQKERPNLAKMAEAKLRD